MLEPSSLVGDLRVLKKERQSQADGGMCCNSPLVCLGQRLIHNCAQWLGLQSVCIYCLLTDYGCYLRSTKFRP